MSNCLFCRIIAGEIPASRVYEDDDCVAILDIMPVNPGHTLVLSRKHSELITGLDDRSLAAMMQAAAKIDAALRASGLRCEAVNLLLADGLAAGQEIAHAHLHVIPRNAGDGFRYGGSKSAKPEREELEGNAAKIKEALAK